MLVPPRLRILASSVMISLVVTSCTTMVQPTPVPVSAPRLEPKLVDIKIIVTPKEETVIPKGSRIVIANISGACADEVKDALMRRLIDNSDYDVLTRDNLHQIIGETNINWEGRFNTETATRLGELLGASLFVVGRVVYCGQAATVSAEGETETQYNVLATLQIIDLETGKVLVSSASEGKYTPRPTALLSFGAPPEQPERARGASGYSPSAAQPQASGSQQPAGSGVWTKLGNTLSRSMGGGEPANGNPAAPAKPRRAVTVRLPDLEPETYAKVKAAEDMANGFADKFFSRPAWEEVQMWENVDRQPNGVLHYVQLGDCARAVRLVESAGAQQLEYMQELDVAKYLHNYGVALLCANNPERAMDKLRSAYRIDNNPSTLSMLGLAAKITEWSLDVEVNKEPEVEMLLNRGTS